MTASKAPQGGMIVNGTYYQGGKYLPRLLKRIRTVRKNAQPVQLAKEAQRDITRLGAEDLVPLVKGAHESGMLEPLLDYLQEKNHPLFPLLNRSRKFFEMHEGDITGKGMGRMNGADAKFIHLYHPEGTIRIAAGRVPVKDAKGKRMHTPGAIFQFIPKGAKSHTESFKAGAPMRPEELHALYDHFGVELQSSQYDFVPLREDNRPGMGRKAPKKVDPDQLARLGVADVLPGGEAAFEVPSLRHEDILHLEDHHQIPKRHRLSNSEGYKVGKDGRIANAKVEHVHSFLDAVANSPVTELPKELEGEALFTHLLTHAVKDASTYLPYVKGEWYGDSVSKMEHAVHDMVSRERPFDPSSHKIDNHPLWGKKGEQSPGLRLLKNVIGFTSNNQKPRDNLMAALKILKTGVEKDPRRPFEQMSEYNTKPLHDFLEHLTKKHGPGDHAYVGLTQDERSAWQKKYGKDLLEHTKSNSGPVSMVEGLTDAVGNVVGRKNIAKANVDFDGNPLPKGKYTSIPFPSTGEDGRMKAKGWSSRASTNAQHIRLLKKIIHTTGGYQEAADWLEQHHPIEELKAMKGGVVKLGEFKDKDTAPGMLVFGEKQGPFVSNLSGNTENVTQDVWWTRSINRWLGKLTTNDKAPNTTQKQFYARVAREAATQLGTTPANLQAILWYAEQHLYRLFGARANSTDFASAAEHAKSAHGFQ